MLESPLPYTRTAGERRDQRLSWRRPDRSFFASGACHILAFATAKRYADAEIVSIVPEAGTAGSHVYARNGQRVFDFNGWTDEAELLAVIERDYQQHDPNWAYEPVVSELGIVEFCSEFQARLPADFLRSPWRRARRYVGRHD